MALKNKAIPYNRAHIIGREVFYIAQAVTNGDLKGGGPFTEKCSAWLEGQFGHERALLTHSCTAALEMSALLLELGPGDEVILPSYTFPSTANAFLLRGAKLVFAEIREDTLNIDENKIEALITDRTRAICVVHYAGVGCEMDVILSLAKKHNICVIEDAAQAIMAEYKGKALGSFGALGAYSFHETKNFSSGEGGALLINDLAYAERAEIIREKGTNRSAFFRGEVDKYSWVDIGSSYVPSEVIAAFLYGQLERGEQIQAMRHRHWEFYYQALKPLEEKGYLKLPFVPDHCKHNAHLFYMLLPSIEERNKLMDYFKDKSVGAVFHYVPLHSSKVGLSLGYNEGDFPITESCAGRILRLPLFCSLLSEECNSIVDYVYSYFGEKYVEGSQPEMQV